ncbi:MAG: class I SAM-dependent methyltransferase [Verrucomicrobiota bacterium]
MQCRKCDFVFLRNPPPYEKLESDFAWEKTSKKVTAKRHTKAPVQAAVAKSTKNLRRSILKRRKIRDLVVKHMPANPGTVVDIGCMKGNTLISLCKELEEAGHNTKPVGIEISADLAAIAQRKLRKIKGTCLHADALSALSSLPNQQSGIVIMSAYLEHEYQPRLVLDQIHRTLTPDGIVVLKVPNYACWNRLLTRGSWCGFRYPDHVNYFTPASLRSLAQRSNLLIKRSNWLDRLPTSDNMYAVLARNS